MGSSGSHTDSSSSSDDAEDVQVRVTNRRPHPRAPTTTARNKRGGGGGGGNKQLVTRQQQQQQQKRHRHPNAGPLSPYDLRVPPPNSTHATGVDARTFADYRMSTPLAV